MRLLATLSAAAVAVTTFAVAPAQGYEKTIRIWPLGCEVTIETNDLSAGGNHHGFYARRSGRTRVETSC